MPRHDIRFGRMVTNVSPTILPLSFGIDMSNIDLDEPGSAKKRNGYQRALSTAFNSTVRFLSKYKDIDGTDVYVVIDQNGLNRAEE